MKTQCICFAFDLFGSAGSAAGAHLLADELNEVLADNRRETVATRARSYTRHVRIQEIDFPDLASLTNWRERGRQLVRQVIHDDDFLVWISGNHLGVLPTYDELATQGDHVLIVQLDAHLDVHHFRDCASELSHGNFLLHVAGGVPPLVNVGHRDLLLPQQHVAATYLRTFSAADLLLHPTRVLTELSTLADKVERIYLDVDCDVFDPTYFPAVAQPVPFGLAPIAVLPILDAIWSDKVRGVCLSEFDPGRDDRDRSLATLVWLIEYLLLRRYEKS